ncbi:MAG: co-chaperone YbbN [Aliivibrio sp.]|uniref:co-chaperone YbbN n=1 Tax=Aliivibrio sp. TaxID=1872443 RepID=UPI001A3A316C|nr:co-chaperone YbbN [Aliivibrio sp.]
MQPNYIIELNQQNFQSVLEGSAQAPLLIHFWAPSQPESADIIPNLQQLAHQYSGQFTLALLNCEQEQMIASQFGVQALPTIALFINGKPVDGMGGLQTVDAITAMLSKHLPSQEELQLKTAMELVDAGEFEQALPTLKSLLSHFEGNSIIKLAIAECLVELHQFDEVEILISSIPMQDQDAKYKGLVAKIELHKQAGDTPEIRQLEEQYNQDPSHLSYALELAIAYNSASRQEEALELLIMILRKDLNFNEGNAKKTIMDILAALGQGNTTATTYRRQLYSLLY